MSVTGKSSQPELSPCGAERRRSARPLKSKPAGTPVWRSRRSIRPWAEASSWLLPPHHAVEVRSWFEDPHEELPRGDAVWLELAHREVGA